MDGITRNTSEFAGVLRRFLDESKIFNRLEWARVLGVSEPAISQWLNDKTMPRAELLRMIVDLVKSRDNSPQDLLREFDLMALKPSDQVTPLWKRLGESIYAYMIRPLLDGFLLDLKALRPDQQEKVLLRASRLCAEEAGFFEDSTEPTAPSARQAGAFTLFDGGGASEIRGGLSKEMVATAEKRMAVLEERVPGLVVKIMHYLTPAPDDRLLPIVKLFCIQAIARVRAQNNTNPYVLVSNIIHSQAVDFSHFNISWTREALNALFLVDEDTIILIKQPGGEFARLDYTFDGDLDRAVKAIGSEDVQYIPVERVAPSYKQVKAHAAA